MSTDPAPPPPQARVQPVRWLPAGVQTSLALQRLALASVVANVVIVVTGGAVRLTNSGLGCPTWPQCAAGSLTPTPKLAINGVVEFTNRSLTGVIAVIAIATWVVAMVLHTERRLATIAALAIPAQAVLGGITVLTHLNPWFVGLHFLLSSANIAVTYWLWWRVRPAAGLPRVDPRPRILARLVAVAAAGTLVLGTVVTGSGPHAGDLKSGTVRRNGFTPSSVSQLHSDIVMVLIGLTVGLLVLVYALHAAESVRRAAVVLLVVELAQGVVGYTQYFLHLPVLLVGIHILGACLVWVAALRVLVAVEPAARRDTVLRTAG